MLVSFEVCQSHQELSWHAVKKRQISTNREFFSRCISMVGFWSIHRNFDFLGALEIRHQDKHIGIWVDRLSCLLQKSRSRDLIPCYNNTRRFIKGDCAILDRNMILFFSRDLSNTSKKSKFRSSDHEEFRFPAPSMIFNIFPTCIFAMVFFVNKQKTHRGSGTSPRAWHMSKIMLCRVITCHVLSLLSRYE